MINDARAAGEKAAKAATGRDSGNIDDYYGEDGEDWVDLSDEKHNELIEENFLYWDTYNEAYNKIIGEDYLNGIKAWHKAASTTITEDYHKGYKDSKAGIERVTCEDPAKQQAYDAGYEAGQTDGDE